MNLIQHLMTANYKEIEHSALELDVKHRAELAKQLIKSLDEQVDEDIEQAWIDEVQRRKQEIRSGKVAPVPGEEVHRNARKLLKQ